MSEDLRENASDEAASSGCSSSVVQLFDQAIVELTDEVMNKCHEGRASLEACVRRRCARLVDQQLEAFREQAAQRELEAAARREERNEAVRKVLALKEQQHKDALDAVTASAATASASASAAAISKLKEVQSEARTARLGAVSVVMDRSEVWQNSSSMHLVFAFWHVLSRRSRPSRSPQEPCDTQQVLKSSDKLEDKHLIKPGLSQPVSSENEPPRNGPAPALSHPQGPPPAHPPRDRPALRSVRSDGSMTPARPGTVPCVEPPAPSVQPPSTAVLPVATAASPSLVCRVESARQPRLGENVGVNQRSTGSLPIASGDVAWSASTRAPSAERQHTYRHASPTPRTRPPALASPSVPLAPQHLQQSLGQQTPTGYRALHAPPGSLAGTVQPPAQATAYSGSTASRAVTPRSSPPTVQMMTAPSAAWQASGPSVSAATPRGNSGSFVAAPPGHMPATVHGFAAGSGPPQRATSGPAGGGVSATQQPALSQMSPPQSAGQVARLRQGSPLSRSRAMEWGPQASGQTAQAYARPHAAWGHV